MKCDEIRTLLNPYVDGELSDAEARQVKGHLEECPACAKEVAGLNRVKEMLHKLPAVKAPEALLERVQAGLPRPTDFETQRTGLLWRYRWLAGSLASAAAVLLVVFIVMTQPRKSDIEMPDVTTRTEKGYEDRVKANLDASTMTKADMPDAIRTQPALYTQQINISARDVNAIIERVYYVASLDMAPGQADEKSVGKAGLPEKGRDRTKVTDDKDLLAKAQNRQAIVTNVGVPYREQRTQFGTSYNQREERAGQQILKVTVPLNQKDEFIRRLKGNIPDKMVFAEMKAVGLEERQNRLSAGYFADASKATEEKEATSGPVDREYDKMARAGGGRGTVGKQAESNKIETEKLSKAKDETAEKKEAEKPKASQGATAMKPAPSASSESPGAPPPPPAAASPPPPASRPAEGLVQSPSEKKKEESKDAVTEKLEAFGDIQNEVISRTRVTTGQAAQVQQTIVQAPDAELPEPMVEFIIIIESESPAAKEK